jgi:hypothetical protein
MKACMSASFWRIEKVKDFLHDCEVIFTTKWEDLRDLEDEFGVGRINLLPHGYQGVVNLIKENLVSTGHEVFGFSDLKRIVKEVFMAGGKPAGDAFNLLGHGYFGISKVPVLLYDEEGVEGFEWWCGKELIGTAMEGEVPPSVIDFAAARF